MFQSSTGSPKKVIKNFVRVPRRQLFSLSSYSSETTSNGFLGPKNPQIRCFHAFPSHSHQNFRLFKNFDQNQKKKFFPPTKNFEKIFFSSERFETYFFGKFRPGLIIKTVLRFELAGQEKKLRGG